MRAVSTVPSDARRRRILLIVVLSVLLGILLLVGASYVATIVLVAAAPVVLVLVPAGAAYGAVVRIVLWIRRRGAGRRFQNPAEVPGGLAAAGFRTPLQRADRALSIALLVVLAVATVFAAGAALLTAAGGDRTTVDAGSLAGVAFGGLAAFPAGIALVLIIAIPVAAIIATMQAVRRDVLVGEAFALETRSQAFRRIRSSRILARVATVGLYVALLVAVAVGAGYFGVGLPRF